MRKYLAATVLAAATVVPGAWAAAADDPSGQGRGQPTPLEQVSAYTEPSIVYVAPTWSGYVYDKFNKMYFNYGQPFTATFQCTGFVVSPDGYIATAGHCVDPEEGKLAVLEQAAQWAVDNAYYADPTLDVETIMEFDLAVVNAEEKRNRADLDLVAAWGVSAGGVETGESLPARVLKRQGFESGDGAIIKVEASDLNALPLAEDDLSVGTEIVAIGYPASVDLVADADFHPTFKEGTISQERTISGGLLTVYEISAAMSGGMSGGPTVNLEGEVVGFNSYTINQQVETQQFNFVRPASIVRELLADAGATNELSETTQLYREGLDALFAGDKTTAVDKLETVVDEQPTNEFASKYLDQAQDLPEPAADESEGSGGAGSGGGDGFPWLPVLIGVGALVVVLAVVLLALMLRRRASRRAQPPMAPARVVATTPVPIAPVPSGPPPVAVGGSGISGRPQALTMPPPPTDATRRREPPQGQVIVTEQGVEHQHLFCGACGAKHQPGQRFCEECGGTL